MEPRSHSRPAEDEQIAVRRPYEKPEIKRVDLALAETLSQGCKLEGTCDAPPVTAYEGGS